MAQVGTTRFKRITDYTPEELDLAVQRGVDHCKLVRFEDPSDGISRSLDFWTLFNAFDAYNEKRSRKNAAARSDQGAKMNQTTVGSPSQERAQSSTQGPRFADYNEKQKG
jgi:hypothetical protein